MSTTIHIDLFSPDSQLAAAVCRLISVMRQGGEIVHLGRRFNRGNSSEVLPLTVLRGDCLDFARDALASDSWYHIVVEYRLHSGRTMPVDVVLTGSAFRGGVPAAYNGHLSVDFELSSLREDEPMPDWAGQSIVLRPEPWLKHGSAPHEDTARLFLECCGLGAGAGVPFVEAAIMSDGGWPSADEAYMVFYRDLGDFARDFARMYAAFHWGMPLYWTLPHDVDIWTFEKRQDGNFGPKCQADRASLRADFCDNELEAIEFEERLDRAVVERLMDLHAEDMRYLFNAVPAETRVRVIDFGDRGMALVGELRETTLVRAYEFVYERFKDIYGG